MKHLKEVDMSKIIPFDTLAYAKKLESHGILPEHAEGHAQVLAEVLEGNFPTRQETGIVVTELSQEINALRKDMDAGFASVRKDMDAGFDAADKKMDAGFAAVRSEMKVAIADTKSELIKWMVGIAFSQLAITVPIIFTIVKYVH